MDTDCLTGALDSHDFTTMDPARSGLSECCYRNGTDRMVIVRCCGPDEFYLERVIFPFEVLAFHCPPASRVEIWTHGLGGPELVEGLSAEELRATPQVLPLQESEGRYAETPWLEAG